MILRQRDSGATLEVGVGDAVTIRLKERPSTGYKWIPASSEGMAQLTSRFESEGMIGGEGTRVFEFRAARSGRSEIRIEHRREWEPSDMLIGRFEVAFIVS